MCTVGVVYPFSAIPSVLWCCWLGGRKGIRPVKTEWWVAGVVICLERGADLHMAQLMLLPLIVSCFSKIQIGFTFLRLADLGSPGKGPLNGCACVCVFVSFCLSIIDRAGYLRKLRVEFRGICAIGILWTREEFIHVFVYAVDYVHSMCM